MNNGKVRIYELSRELNLDNKDILAVCDRLNIAVKSHSSTITEEEAAQIRAAAMKQGADLRKDLPKLRNVSDKSKSGGRSPVRKQQILEIRRHRTTPTPPKPPEAGQDQESAPQEDVSSPPKVGTVLTPPARPKPPTAVAPKATEEPEEKPETVMAERPQSPQAVSPPLEVKESKPPAPATQQQPPKPRPTLVKPPSRPSEPKEEAPRMTDVPVARSTPKPQKPILVKPRGVDESRPTTAEEPVEKLPALKPKPKPELRRPKASPATGGDEDKETAETMTPAALGTSPGLDLEERPILKRPTPPRQQKRRSGEEEEDDEIRMKAGKGPAKGKRRSQAILDDDEDFEELLDDGDDSSTSSQLSLSLARPPKPKSRQATPKPAATAATAKPRRTTGSKEGGYRGQRRERREEVKQERPELLVLTGGLSVHELADKLMVPETEIIRTLFLKGIATNVNQTLDIPTIEMVAEEYDVVIETAEAESEARKVTEMIDAEDLEKLQPRPPVVTIMGHVDHGKTTLLDSIRKTKVAQGEAGGITQHIGAYHVDLEHAGESRQIVFLDTPGHEAFTAMRARGTRVTDIAVLVVAADDGVRPQTVEAISHAKAAAVPIVVAINKIDKESAQPDRVKQELMEYGLVPEEWGGETIMVPVSALSSENLDTLLEMLLLVAEIEDLQANPDRAARGTVIEANLDKARGPVATLLVQNGTLHVGDSLVVGPVFGKVRAMIDDRGHRVEAATPSFAVEVLGLNDVPAAGDEFEVFTDEKKARELAGERADKQRQSRLQQAMASRRVTLNTLSAQAQEGELKELNLVLKADVQGSVEAILGALQQLPQDEVQIRVLLAAPGEISETDVDLAAASSAIIVGFNTTLAPGARQAADRSGVDVQEYDIIYQLLEDIQGAMEGLLEPELVEEPLGQVEVRAVFPLRRGTVAGSYVKSGKVTRNCRVRVHRKGEVIYEGTLDSLKRMKEDAKEVNAGFECGIGIDNFNDWQEGDMIEAFRMATKRRTLAMA